MSTKKNEEYVDYYNEKGEVIGYCTRAEADLKNYIYPNSIVFVFTPDGRIWIQKRSLTKSHYPGMWDTSACGAIAHNEDPRVAAERELKEEMGIDCSLEFADKFLNTFRGEGDQLTRSRMSHIFIGISDQAPEGNHEVEAVAAFTISELLAEIKQNPQDFMPSFDIELDMALKKYEALQN